MKVGRFRNTEAREYMGMYRGSWIILWMVTQ